MNWKSTGWKFLLVVFSIAYGVVMLGLNGMPISDLYSTSPYHRYQALALLHGHFYLSDSIYAIQPGLAWHNGQVHQVWGLGVGIWLLPFQAAWSLFGGGVFPDRIALAAAFALLGYYSIITGISLVKKSCRMVAIGFVWLILLYPPFWTLARASHLIFEETVLYATILSLGVLVSLIRVTAFGSKADCFLCCALGLFSWWVRPTHGIYGSCAAIFAVAIVWKRTRSMRWPALALAGCFLSVALLGWTNFERFGSPLEFGHRLTISSGTMVHLTRFENPYYEAKPGDAAIELFGLLFLNSRIGGQDAFAEDLFLGQAAVPRWRRFTFSSFDLTYAAFGISTAIWISLRLAHRQRKNPGSLAGSRLVLVALFCWSAGSFLALAGFYLYYPVIASRYLLDFAPALAGFTILAWVILASEQRILSCLLFGAWLCSGLFGASVPRDPPPSRALSRNQMKLAQNPQKHLEDYNGVYSATNNPLESGVACNGLGWLPDSGFADEVVSLAVDGPEFVELRVSERRAFYGDLARKDTYNAVIDGSPLSFVAAERENDQLKLLFSVPTAIRKRDADEFLFLSFADSYHREDRHSERILHSVRWR